jgi:hypothetical protein
MNRRLTTFGSLILALTSATAALAQSEVEPNNTIAQATVLASPTTTVTGIFAAPGVDYDYLRFTLTETASVSILLWGPTPGVCPTGIFFDPFLTLFNASGQVVAQNDDAQTLCPRLDATTQPVMGSLPAGTYYIEARLLGGATTPMPYTLVMSANAVPVPIAERVTYQGKLASAGSAVSGEAPMRFSLWSHPTNTEAGDRLSLPIQYPGVAIIGGLFSVDLDFTIPNAPANYDGTERYLQIEVADLNGSGNFTTLLPRQRLAPAPHAIYALRAGAAARATLADNATNASSAFNAQNAVFAQQAGSANTATTAGSASTALAAPWSGLVGVPFGFTDGIDNTGGWVEDAANDKAYTTRQIGINTSATGSFSFAVAGTAAKTGGGSWAVFSDERLKHDIKPMAGTLDRLLQLRGYTYEYNTDAVESRLALPGTQIGLMAQEVERIFPDWVAKDDQGYRYVTERSTTALMVEALRDLRTEKDAAIQALREQNERLQARLDRLESALLGKK